jgi:hypothetical protein
MIKNENMLLSFSFDQESQPAVQLLAFSLELRKLLVTHGKLIGVIPKTVFQAMPSSSFQELIFDTLSPLYIDLENRLTLKVHDSKCFEIKTG